MEQPVIPQSYQVVVVLPKFYGGDLPESSDWLSCENLERYVNTLIAELYFRSHEPVWSEGVVREVRFVGGSSWLMSPRYLREIISALREWFSLDPNCIFEAVAQPWHLHSDSFASLSSAGLTHLRLRARSLDEHVIQKLGFHYTAERLKRLMSGVCESSLRMSLDLCYGLPFESFPSFRDSLCQFLPYSPVKMHFFPPGNLHPFLSRHKVEVVSENQIDNAVLQRKFIANCLECYGYRETGIDEYRFDSSPRVLSRLTVESPQLGIGAGAISRFTSGHQEEISYQNTKSADSYMDRIARQGRAERFRRSLTNLDQFHEALATALRSPSGLHLRALERKFGVELEQVHPGLAHLLITNGYLNRNGEFLKLSWKGGLFAGNVIKNFFIESADVPYLLGERFYSRP